MDSGRAGIGTHNLGHNLNPTSYMNQPVIQALKKIRVYFSICKRTMFYYLLEKGGGVDSTQQQHVHLLWIVIFFFFFMCFLVQKEFMKPERVD